MEKRYLKPMLSKKRLLRIEYFGITALKKTDYDCCHYTPPLKLKCFPFPGKIDICRCALSSPSSSTIPNSSESYATYATMPYLLLFQNLTSLLALYP